MAYEVRVKNMVKFMKNYRKFPAILAGKHPEFKAIYDRYWATFTQQMFKFMYASYETRSLGGADDIGQSWSPLKPKTVKTKGRPHWGRGQPKVRVPAAKNPSQINVDTGETLESLKPGFVSGNTYSPYNAKQKVVMGSGKLTLGTKCYWHPVVLTKRKWWTRKTIWTKQAAKEAFKSIIPLLPLLGA